MSKSSGDVDTSEIVADTPAPGPWYVWDRYGVEEYATRDKALCAAWGAHQSDDGWVDCIEGPDGVMPAAELDAELEARDLAYAQELARETKSTHGVKLRSPQQERLAWFGTYSSAEDAERDAERLRARFGDRVVLRELVNGGWPRVVPS